MIDDNTTFFLAFAGSLAFVAWYLWRLDRKVDAVQRRLDDLRATMPKNENGEDRP